MELDFDNELDRKVSETVAHVATLVEERIMSRENAHHAINALYMGCYGLNGHEVSELLSDALNEFRDGAPSMFPFVVKTPKGDVVVVRVNIVHPAMTMTMIGSEVNTKSFTYDSAKEALSGAAKVVTTLLKSGGVKC